MAEAVREAELGCRCGVVSTPGSSDPDRVELATGHHLRPIRATDVDVDYPAVVGSRESLWAKYGEPWGWPPPTMTLEQDRDDLAHHEREIAAHETFNYAVLNADETELLGCVYIDPPRDDSPNGTDAIASWWVVDGHAGGALDTALSDFVPGWLTEAWNFRTVPSLTAWNRSL